MEASTSSMLNNNCVEDITEPTSDVNHDDSEEDNNMSENDLPNLEKERAAVIVDEIEPVIAPTGHLSKKTSTKDFPVNKRALRMDADDYELEKFQQNLLIIFSQQEVAGHDERVGTEKDVKALQKAFKKFGFQVNVHRNYTKSKIMKKLNYHLNCNKDFSDYGCIAVAILTHGSTNGFLRAADQQFSEIEFINHLKILNNQTLITKPRIIMIQACRGKKEIPGVPVNVSESETYHKDLDDGNLHYYLPVEADMIVLHSSYYDTVSIRNPKEGSWFLQEVCKHINSLASSYDLESIMTKVRKEIAIRYEYKLLADPRNFVCVINEEPLDRFCANFT